jgi:DNA polymerase III alpha subunit (gram-positive type)
LIKISIIPVLVIIVLWLLKHYITLPVWLPVVENTNKIADMVEIIEVIIETGGVPFSPRVKGEDGNYLDCPKVVTELVYTKAKEWYGEPLPYNIEERIAKELYGDAVLNTIKYN